MVLRNDEFMAQMDSEFQRSNDSSFAWESMISAYLGLPGLRGFWPMSTIGTAGLAMDLSGQALHLTTANTPIVGMYPPLYLLAAASSERLYRADSAAHDIIGNEAYIASSWRGMTVGAWVKFTTTTTSTQEVIMSKWNTTSQRAYIILIASSDDHIQFQVSTDGTAVVSADSGVEPDTGKWYFVVGRFDPSTEMAIWVNETVVKNVASIPATIHDSTEEFCIGAINGGAAYGDISVSMAFLTCTQLTDAYIRKLYYRTRPLFQSRADW